MKGFGLYLIILVCLLAGVSYVVSQTQQTETLSYNQIYNYFMDGDVDQYDVDDTTSRHACRSLTAVQPAAGRRSSANVRTVWPASCSSSAKYA